MRRIVQFNDESEIDKELKDCTDLTGYGSFSRLPKGIEFLTLLTYLNVSGNQLECLPDLSSLTSLQTLFAFSNSISRVGKLPQSLLVLNLHDNQISQLPPLPQLRTLELRGNQISKIVLPLGLEFVSLFQNQLEKIDLRSQTRLQNLDLGRNKIQQISNVCVANWIGLDENPLTVPNLPSIQGLKASKVCAAFFSASRANCALACKVAPIEITYSDTRQMYPWQYVCLY